MARLLLLAATFLAVSGENLPGPCREWNQGEGWLCTSEETYQRCHNSLRPGCPETDRLTPVQPSGHCRLVNGICQYTESSPQCLSGYKCSEPYCATTKPNSTFPCPRVPVLDNLCLPVDDSCQWFNPCRAWKGHCQSPYCCGTLSEYYRFIFGPTPMGVMPEEEEATEPVPPGECVIIANGECGWSNCTAFMEWCQSGWICGTHYDLALHLASPPPSCPQPLPNPPQPGPCLFNLKEQHCQFKKGGQIQT